MYYKINVAKKPSRCSTFYITPSPHQSSTEARTAQAASC